MRLLAITKKSPLCFMILNVRNMLLRNTISLIIDADLRENHSELNPSESALKKPLPLKEKRVVENS